jgi:hypothetical protein
LGVAPFRAAADAVRHETAVPVKSGAVAETAEAL